MKILTIPILLLACWFSGISQTSLQGKVSDTQSGHPIIFGTVALYQNGVLITGTETDFDGFFSITELDPGTYDVAFSYTGYFEKKVPGVTVTDGKANKLDVKMRAGAPDCCPCIGGYILPLIKQDDTTQGFTFSSEDLRHMPYRW